MSVSNTALLKVKRGLANGTIQPSDKRNLFEKSIDNANLYQERYAPEFEGLSQTNNMFAQLANDLNAERGKAYTDTTEGKSFLATLRDQSQQATQNVANSANLLNLSPEAQIAMQGQIAQNQAGSIRDMVAGSDQRRNSLTAAYQGALAQLYGGQQGLFGAKYGIDRDVTQAKLGLEAQRYAARQQRKGANAQAIGGAVGNLFDLGGSIWGDKN